MRLALFLAVLLAAPLATAQDAPLTDASEIDQMPELVGGLEGVAAQLRYPDLAKKAGIEGRVVVKFVVDEAGAVQDAEVVKGLDGGLSEEALRVVRGLAFEPGMDEGEPVKVAFVLPVTFRLPEDAGDAADGGTEDGNGR